jgi:threonine-phosphate decarboxylase
VADRKLPEALSAFIASQIGAVAAYPEPDSAALRGALGEQYAVSPQQIFVTNGSTEAFYVIAAAFRAGRSLVFSPAFAEYEDACRMHDHTLFFKSNLLIDEPLGVNVGLVWLANPNNPDGRLCPKAAIEKLLRLHSDTVFVVDEAYGELCRGFESVSELLAEFDNLIVVKSMTKQYILPGLRLGFMLTGKALAARLQRFRIPWSVNAIAQRVGLYLLRNEKGSVATSDDLLQRSVVLQQQLSTLPEIEVIPSPCNFFLVRLKEGDAATLKAFLIDGYGFLVRDASNFRGLDNRFIRISVQTGTENEQLFGAIRSFLEQRLKNKEQMNNVL